ncbi:MAG: S8 family serine peptidase [Phormidesmis sp. RL_2_1]|nr:S8 family serine peptidase [Phormidesmis sp. RL_2_1]
MENTSLLDATNWQNPWINLDTPSLSQTNWPLLLDYHGPITHCIGELGADHFTIQPADRLTVISGNGNIDYGEGKYDLLDLSHLSSTEVVEWVDAAFGDGILFNPGNGARVFDGILLADGHQILFEGLDIVQFSDKTIYFSICPNDPEFYQQWNLHMMGVHNAWRFTQGSSDVLVGIQDTGLGYTADGNAIHPDLAEAISLSDNLADDFTPDHKDSSLAASYITSHGTRVQSIISAVSNNGKGISGINWKSKVAHVDVVGDDPDDLSLEEATRFLIETAQQAGQRLVVNMSLCINAQSSLEAYSLHRAFAQLVEENKENALFVISVGNENCDRIAYPASLGKKHKNVIAVGAVWGKKARQYYQPRPGIRIDYGNHGSNYGFGLSLMGPAEMIAASASVADGRVHFGLDPAFQGTSSAAPNVAGVASLVWSVCPELSAEQVHCILVETAYRPEGETYSEETGYGLVYADSAVRRAIAIKKYLIQSPSTSTNYASHIRPSVPVCQLTCQNSLIDSWQSVEHLS